MMPSPHPYTAYKPSGVPWLGDMRERRRRLMRLQGFDYTRQGAYFITICTRNRECLLGDVGEGRMHLNEAGLFAQAAWEDLPRHYPHVALDAWTIMPNHVHGIVVLTERVKAPPEGSGLKPDPTNANAVRHGLPEVVRAFKTFSARRINVFRGAVGAPFWQRNYYEHVIRNEESLNRIRQYILDNPARWHEDPENPAVRANVGSGLKPDPTEGGMNRRRLP